MIYGVLLVLYLIVVIVMIAAILIQEPREGGLSGAIGGGGVENVLGVRGAPTFFQKLTAILGALFIIMSLVLSFLHSPTKVKGTAIEKAVKKTPIQLPPVPQAGEEGETPSQNK